MLALVDGVAVSPLGARAAIRAQLIGDDELGMRL